MMIRPGWNVFTLVAVPVLLMGMLNSTAADPLETARVHRTLNQVLYYQDVNRLDEADTAVAGKTVLRGSMALKTGKNSMSELLFKDDSLLRLGSYSLFSFESDTRELRLPTGSMLYQLPEKSPTTNVRAGGATVGVLGTTVMLEHKADHYIKVIVLEGSARVDWKQDRRLLSAGQMLLFSVDAGNLPRPVIIDLAHLKKTARLLNGFKSGDEEQTDQPSNPLNEQSINRAIQEQRRRLREGTLRKTGVRIKGRRRIGSDGDEEQPPITEQKPTGEDLETVEERLELRKLRHPEPAEH